MIRLLRDFRLIPVVLAATICLFVLKTFGLVFDGGYTLNALHANDDITGSIAVSRPDSGADNRPTSKPEPKLQPKPQPKPQSWAQQMLNYPDITGSAAEPKPAAPAAKGDASKGEAPKGEPSKGEPSKGEAQKSERPGGKPPDVTAVNAQSGDRSPSRAERAILERLQERRLELEARARDLEMRESLLKAAEKRLESRLIELKDAEARITAATQQKDEAEAARFKNLITMYENMKAKEAAKIFDRLDLNVLVDVANQLNPRRMSDIMAQMAPEAAERLTVELAARAKNKGQAADLPKIEGKPLTN